MFNLVFIRVPGLGARHKVIKNEVLRMQLCRYTKPLSGLSDYIALDTETTGLDRYKDKIIEIGMIEVRGNQIVDSFHSFINPERHIPAAASKVNHIYDEDVEDAPTYDQIAPVIAAKLQKKTVVAHNSYFDMSFIVNMLDERGFTGRINHVDTLYFSRCMVHGMENYKLGTLAAHFGIDPGDFHRAIDDARVCHELFQKLKALPEADGFAQKPVEYIRPEDKPAQPEAQPIIIIQAPEPPKEAPAPQPKRGSSKRSKGKRPLAVRWWYIVFALDFVIVSISLISDGETGGGLFYLAIGLVMLLFTVRQFSARRKERKTRK